MTSDIPSLANYVTLDGTQSITGYKTFLFIGIFVIVLINVSLNVFAHEVAYSSDLLYDIAYRILSLEYYY